MPIAAKSIVAQSRRCGRGAGGGAIRHASVAPMRRPSELNQGVIFGLITSCRWSMRKAPDGRPRVTNCSRVSVASPSNARARSAQISKDVPCGMPQCGGGFSVPAARETTKPRLSTTPGPVACCAVVGAGQTVQSTIFALGPVSSD